MYNFVVKKYLDYEDCRYYTSPVKTDDDRIKPRKKIKRVVDNRKWYLVSYNPFTGEKIVEDLETDCDSDLEYKRYLSEKASYNRTRQVIFDLCMSNMWEYFVTFTFSAEKVDRYSYEDCSKKMVYWINNVKKKFSPELKYVVVPEQHKDGAWHFHGVFSNVGSLSFVDSGRKDNKGRIVYNLYEYKFGFTTATIVGDNLSTCLYIQKYISKDMCKNLFNKKRYWCSRNLDRPVISKQLHRDEEFLDKFRDGLAGKDYKEKVVNAEYYDIHRFSIYTTNTNFSKRYRQNKPYKL